jgi:beta-lactam-binding protein with PASTA domain
VRWSQVLIVLACVAAVLGLGLASLFDALGGGGRAPSATATTTSTTNLTVELVGPNAQNRHVAVPNVVGDTQAKATATLAAVGLGTSAASMGVNNGTPIGTVLVESPWSGSIVVTGSHVSIKVAG